MLSMATLCLRFGNGYLWFYWRASACGRFVGAGVVGGNSKVVLSGRIGYIVSLHNPGVSALALEKIMAVYDKKPDIR